MGIPRIQKCCCCSVKVGTLVLLYMGLFAGINNLYMKTPYSDFPDQPLPDDEDAKAFVQNYKYTMDYIESSRVPSAVIEIVVAVLGLYGVYKEEHLFLIPILICYVSGLIALALISIVAFIALLYFGYYVAAITFIIVINLFTALSAWLTQVVYSHYCEIKEKKEQPWKASYVV